MIRQPDRSPASILKHTVAQPLAEKELQWALAATDTPQVVEEILEARITSAQEYLQQWAQSAITWVS